MYNFLRLAMNGGAAPFPVMGASKAAPRQPARHYYFSKHKKGDKKRLTKVKYFYLNKNLVFLCEKFR